MGHEKFNSSVREQLLVPIRSGRKTRSYRDIATCVKEFLGDTSIGDYLKEGGSYGFIARTLGVNETSLRDVIHGVPTANIHSAVREERRHLVSVAMELDILSILSERQLQVVASANLVEPPLRKTTLAEEFGVTKNAIQITEHDSLRKLRRKKRELLPPPQHKTRGMIKVENAEGRPIEDLVFLEEQKDTTQEDRAARFGIKRESYYYWRRMLGYKPEKVGRKAKRRK